MIELKLLKKCLTDIESLSQCVQKDLKRNYFNREECGYLYKIITWYYENYKAFIQEDSLKITLESSAMTPEIKGKVELVFNELTNIVCEEPVDFLIDSFIKGYKEREMKNELINIVEDLNKVDIDKIMNRVKKKITSLELVSSEDVREGDIKSNTELRYKNYLEVKGGKATGLFTGFPTLDYMTGGMKKGEEWVVCGLPKHGKSMLMLNIGHHAWKQGKNVLYVSAELYKPVIERRFDVLDSGVSDWALKHGKLSVEDEKRYLETLEKHKEMPNVFYTFDTPTCTTNMILNKIQELKTTMNVDLVIVDYLRLIEPRDKGANQYEYLGNVALDLRRIARTENVPILTAHQLTRESTGKGRLGVENIAGSMEVPRHVDFTVAIKITDEDEKNQSPICEMDAFTLLSRDSATKDFKLEACFDLMRITENSGVAL